MIFHPNAPTTDLSSIGPGSPATAVVRVGERLWSRGPCEVVSVERSAQTRVVKLVVVRCLWAGAVRKMPLWASLPRPNPGEPWPPTDPAYHEVVDVPAEDIYRATREVRELRMGKTGTWLHEHCMLLLGHGAPRDLPVDLPDLEGWGSWL